MNLSSLLSQIASQHQLPPSGTHGWLHWRRNLEDDLSLADIEGGDASVMTLFPIFLDACRFNQSIDPCHGNPG